VSLQVGGGMGIVSVGTGWSYGQKQNWETDLYIGLIPKYDSNTAKFTVAIKENFIPWKISVCKRISIEPLTASVYITSVLNNSFWTKQPGKYPQSYYRLPTKLRFNISIGQRLVWKQSEKCKLFDSISAYYEIGTCDIYMLSAFGNKYLKPDDWLFLCLGLRFNI